MYRLKTIPFCLLTLVFHIVMAVADEQLAQLPKTEATEANIEPREPDPAKAMIELGIKYCNERKYEQAIAEYEQVLSRFPGTNSSAEAQFRIANVYHWALKMPDKALNLYQAVIDNYPDSKFAVESLLRMGSIYHWELDTPDPHKAIEYYQRMLSIAPDSENAPEAMFWIGEAYNWMLEDKDKAIEVYQRLIDNYPKSNYAVKAQVRIAGIYRKQDDYWDDPRAKEIYERIISEYSEGPEVEEARYFLGVFYLHKGDIESALKEFRSALNYSTDHIECLYWTGYRLASVHGCYRCPAPSKGKDQEALEQFLKIHRESFPSSCQRVMSEKFGTRDAILAQYYLGKFYFDENDYEKAIETFSKVMDAIPKHDKIYYKSHFYIAWSYALNRQYEDSIKEYQKMLEYVKDKAGVLYNIATTYEEAKDFTSAKVYYGKILELYPGTPNASEASKRLRIIEILGY